MHRAVRHVPRHPRTWTIHGQHMASLPPHAATCVRVPADVQPTLLLFLQKLQCLVIQDAVAGTSSIMYKHRCALRAHVAQPVWHGLAARGSFCKRPGFCAGWDGAPAADQHAPLSLATRTRPCAPVRARRLSPNLIELRHGPKAEHASQWLVTTGTFTPNTMRNEVVVSETSVSLAFSLTHHGQQHVFAFLPLKSYGLKFMVQADFIVTAAR